jgi:hypothetical protein
MADRGLGLVEPYGRPCVRGDEVGESLGEGPAWARRGRAEEPTDRDHEPSGAAMPGRSAGRRM